MFTLKNSRTARIITTLFAFSLVVSAQSAFGGDINPYDSTTYANDSAGMLDAINRNSRGGSGNGYLSSANGGMGSGRINPYSSQQYDSNASGLLDAVNRDAGRSSGYVAYATPAVRSTQAVASINPYSFQEYDSNAMAMLDAINGDAQVRPARSSAVPTYQYQYQAPVADAIPSAASDGYASSTYAEPIG